MDTHTHLQNDKAILRNQVHSALWPDGLRLERTWFEVMSTPGIMRVQFSSFSTHDEQVCKKFVGIFILPQFYKCDQARKNQLSEHKKLSIFVIFALQGGVYHILTLYATATYRNGI